MGVLALPSTPTGETLPPSEVASQMYILHGRPFNGRGGVVVVGVTNSYLSWFLNIEVKWQTPRTPPTCFCPRGQPPPHAYGTMM